MVGLLSIDERTLPNLHARVIISMLHKLSILYNHALRDYVTFRNNVRHFRKEGDFTSGNKTLVVIHDCVR